MASMSNLLSLTRDMRHSTQTKFSLISAKNVFPHRLLADNPHHNKTFVFHVCCNECVSLLLCKGCTCLTTVKCIVHFCLWCLFSLCLRFCLAPSDKKVNLETQFFCGRLRFRFGHFEQTKNVVDFQDSLEHVPRYFRIPENFRM